MTAPLLDPPRTPLASAPPGPVIRRPVIRRVPPLEPPYDDELAAAHLQLVPQLEELPFDDPAPRRFEHEIDFFDPQPTPRRDLPDPERWATRFLQAVLETLAGCRPSVQLQECTSPTVHAQVVGDAQGRQWISSARALPIVRSVHVSEPADGVAEVCALVQRGRRFGAVAARWEGFDGRGRCVALELG